MKTPLFFLSLLLLFACNSQIKLPPQSAEMSARKYNQYCTMYNEAKAKNDYFYQAIALCNLKREPKQVYRLLHKAIQKHDTLCYQIHDYQQLHKKGTLTVSFIRMDSVRWERVYKEAEKKVSLEQFYIKQQEKTLAYQKKEAILKSKLDTTQIDKKMVARLKEIMKKDQAIRGLPFMNGYLNGKNKRWAEQKLLDSLNLVKVDSIFKAGNAYPSIEKVGYDKITVPWYVLHHQTSPIVRKKYLTYLEEAVKKGYLSKEMLETYNERTLANEEREMLERNNRP